MSCVKQFLGVQWDGHAWKRQVVHTEGRSFHQTDMWSRVVPFEGITCHAQYVCGTCGEVRDEGDCNCDRADGEKCAVRLELTQAGAARS